MALQLLAEKKPHLSFSGMKMKTTIKISRCLTLAGIKQSCNKLFKVNNNQWTVKAQLNRQKALNYNMIQYDTK